jgi:hypothetical protein
MCSGRSNDVLEISPFTVITSRVDHHRDFQALPAPTLVPRLKNLIPAHDVALKREGTARRKGFKTTLDTT